MRVNFSKAGDKNYKLKFIQTLIRQFAEFNDIHFGNDLKGYINSPQGSKALASWANSQGYGVTYWCMPPYKKLALMSGIQARYEEIWVGFGIDIDDSNPLIVELKLKAS